MWKRKEEGKKEEEVFGKSYTSWKGKCKEKSHFSAFQPSFQVFQLQIVLDLQLLSWHVMEQLFLNQLPLEAITIFSWKSQVSRLRWISPQHSQLHDRCAIIIIENYYLKRSSLFLKLLKGLNYRTCSKRAPENISASVKPIVNCFSLMEMLVLHSNDVLCP